MTPKKLDLEGKTWTLGVEGGQKLAKFGRHHLCTHTNKTSLAK